MIKRIRNLVMGGVAAMLLLTSCEYRWGWRDHDQVIEPLNMRFHIHRNDSTNVISFGAADAEKLDNYIEEYQAHDIGGRPFYFFIDNTSGKQKVRDLIVFPERKFFDFHLPDYRYKIFISAYDPEVRKYWLMQYYVESLPKLNADSILPKTNIVFEACVAPYSRGIEYRTYDMGNIIDFDSYIDTLLKTQYFIPFLQMEKEGQPLGYEENVSLFGPPLTHDTITVSTENRKSLIADGMLFLDTLDLSNDIVIEKCKWQTSNRMKTTILYKVINDSTKIPINGVSFANYIDDLHYRIIYE